MRFLGNNEVSRGIVRFLEELAVSRGIGSFIGGIGQFHRNKAVSEEYGCF